MPIITKVVDYDGVGQRIQRLGLTARYEQAVECITNWQLLIEEKKHANGTRGIRQVIDGRFEAVGGWSKKVSGDLDWAASAPETGAHIGVEVQVSGRSDLLIKDVLHVKRSLAKGILDVGIIVVPDNALSFFLTDRTPNLAHAIMHITEADASDLPIRVLSFKHDGLGPPLAKMVTNMGKGKAV